MNQKPKVLVIVGPTASGKTSLSINLAQRFGGEVISADSRQVYRGLNIGTGKVTAEEMRGIPHHLLDIANPKDTYTVADFVRDGRTVIKDITTRNTLPIIVGGSFFYVDALLGKISTPDVPPNPQLREHLGTLSTEELNALLAAKDSVRAETIDPDNRVRLIRAIEITEALGSVPQTKPEALYETLILGIDIPKETLHNNIHNRLISRIEGGMIEEVEELHSEGLSFERMEDLGLEYRYIARHLKGELKFCEMLDELETKIKQYAKRQMTWLKRDKTIVWIQPEDATAIDGIVSDFLNN